MVIDRPTLSPTVRRLLAATPVAAVLVLGVAIAVGLSRVRETRREVGRTRDVLLAADSVLQRLTDAETGQRGLIITGDTAYLGPYRGAKRDIAGALAHLRGLVADDASQLPRADSLGASVAARLLVLDGRIDVRERFGFDSARASLMAGGGLPLMQQVRALVGAISAHERRHLADRIEAEERTTALLMVVIVLGTLATAAATAVLNRVLLAFAARERAAAVELDAQNMKLQDQAMELEQQQQQLQEQAVELEAQAAYLHDQTAELEAMNEELRATGEELEVRTESAERLRTEADAANRAKTDFLAMMSHELRTPLNAIAGYVDLIELGLRGPVSDLQQADLARIRQNGRHLLAIINDVLNFAKLEAGKLELRIERVRLPDLAKELHDSVAPLLAAAGLMYEVRAGPDDDAFAMADRERLRQILVNLLTNAIKYTPRGGRVEVVSGCDDGWAWLSVRDTGRGIDPAKLETIFEPFVQVDRHLVDGSRQGVGLGLAISRELARTMGGDLTVESTPGAGSTFTLRIPRVLVEQVDRYPDGEAARADHLTT